MHPRVSVCIPTYNYANYISSAIESVLGQDFGDFELIIQDDCSADNTEEVVGRFSDPRIRFGRNKQNLGLAGNWNHCLTMARGRYIKYVFADDLLASNHALSQMVSILEAYPEVSLVASARNFIDENSQIKRVESCFPNDMIVDGKDIIRQCLRKQHNKIGEPTVVMFRKAQAARGFNGEYQQVIDMEMWFYLLEQGKFAFFAHPLCSFRVHSGQKTADNIKNLRYLDDYFLLLRDYSGKPYIGAGRVTRWYWRLDTLYHFWKLKKKGIIDRREVLARIANHMPPIRFFAGYPIYKTAKPFVKLYDKLAHPSE